MDFSDKKSIYLQIVELVEDRILENKLREDQKIPSVRDLAVELQVNPNTVMRSYEILQQHGIIVNRRGLGMFVSTDALNIINMERKQNFIENEVPQLFRKMTMLGIPFNELKKLYKKFSSDNEIIKTGSYEEE